MNERTALYRYYDSEGNLLYVGISVSAARRMEQHKQAKIWFKNLARVRVEHFSDRDSALQAEKKVNQGHSPYYRL
jgi:predicted GIY-YIG superfamily endonuclease